MPMSSDPAVHADGGDHLVTHVLVELVLDPHAVLGAALLVEPHAPGHAVARVDLDLPGLDERAERLDEQEALDLLGVSSGGRKDEDRLPELAPPSQRHLLVETG